VSAEIKETVFVIFFAIWLALAIPTLLFYRRRDLAFRKRWHPYVYALHVVVLGTPLLVIPRQSHHTPRPTDPSCLYAASTCTLIFTPALSSCS
jgi:hypothetical protein